MGLVNVSEDGSSYPNVLLQEVNSLEEPLAA